MGDQLDIECADCGLRSHGISTGVGRMDTLTEDRVAWCRHCETIVSAEYVRPLAELRESSAREMLRDFSRSEPDELMPLVELLRARPRCPDCGHGVRQVLLGNNGETECPGCDKPSLGWLVTMNWD